MRKLIRRYRDVGMRIAIDDFGSGHSHIDRLLELEPDIIKLDMGLFQRAAKGGLAAQVVFGISDIARRSGSALLCEGVETEQAFRFALDCGARYLQGFFFSAAQPAFFKSEWAEQRLIELLPGYLSSKKSQVQSRALAQRALLTFFDELRRFLLIAESEVALLPAPPKSFLRFFICANNGRQLSPNYEYSDGECWIADESNLDCNWAVRPYFYQLLAGEGQESLVSDPYHDASSGQTCVTFGCRVDSERLLFMDRVLSDSLV